MAWGGGVMPASAARRRYWARERPPGPDRAFGRGRRAVVRARPDGGRAAGARDPLVHDRDAAGGRDRPRSSGQVRPLLRAAAEGRGLLGQLGADGGALRRRRPPRQAHLQARELVAAVPGPLVRAATGRARRPGPRPAPPPARRPSPAGGP